jgi:glycosyltransferase involved in cell wall biosynthesis
VKVVHVITGLENGGAEGALYRLVESSLNQHEHIVVSLTTLGKYGALFLALNIEVVYLNMPKGRASLHGVKVLFSLLRNKKPDVVQTWMYHADLFGGVIAKLAGIDNIVWGIRHTNHNKEHTSLTTRSVTKLCAFLSYVIPKSIISCSVKAVSIHMDLGYKKDKFKVVPNGYDFSKLKFSFMGSKKVREELGLTSNDFLIGCVGRWNSQKDHPNLLRSLSLLKQENVSFHCILVGNGCDHTNHILMEEVIKHGLKENVTLMGPRSDVVDVMSSLDLHVLPSAYGEAFPNVLVEAMACNTPCVATCVGDSDVIIGDFGWVVPARNPTKLARSIKSSIELKKTKDWDEFCCNSRKRVQDNFSIDKMCLLYEKVWNKI